MCFRFLPRSISSLNSFLLLVLVIPELVEGSGSSNEGREMGTAEEIGEVGVEVGMGGDGRGWEESVAWVSVVEEIEGG